MRVLIAAVAAVAAVGLTAGTASANPIPGPPFVDHAEWAHWGDLSSLRVYPTVAGREAAGQVHNATEGDEAWTEVLALAPDADIPGMREQFICHWTYAEFAQPGKSSWNLEPWRPVVDEDTMVGTGCNPGGTEEPF
jgi:hypothetical protein